MVMRVVSRPHNRVAFFLLSWGWYLLLFCLVNLALESWLDLPCLWDYGVVVVLLVSFCAIWAWLSLRAWARAGRFCREGNESFLTMVDAGLLIEHATKGTSFYLPWEGLSYRCRGNMLQFFTRGAIRYVLYLNGVSADKREAVLAGLREHTGQPPAGRGFFSAETPSAPFRPAAPTQRPPKSAPHLPAPTPVTATSPAHYSNEARQWQEYLAFALRPDWVKCLLFYMVGIAGLSLGAGAFAWGESWLAAALYALGAAFLLRRMLRPPRCLPHLPGPIRMELSRTEILERWEDGSWARFRLPTPEAGNLIRLPHAWCLTRNCEPGAFLFDAEHELPPQLGAYRRSPAPRSILRGVLGLVVALLGGAYGYFLFDFPAETTEAERAFQALPKGTDEPSLRAFVEAHYAQWPLHETPLLTPCYRRDGQGLAGYILLFTEEEPAAQDARTCHLVVSRVRLYPDGGLHDWERGPSPQCRCAACSAAHEAEEPEDE